ncbi:preprotein translocase subunit YajC [Lactobacillus hominis]|nr:preprotein translocase subunit YajC [Lactobacillus hominis]
MIVVFIALLAFMYFFVMRPQKKQQQARMQMMSKLQKGDCVVMMSGLHGKIDSINKEDNTVVIDADGIYLTFARMAIRQVLPSNSVSQKDVESNEAKEEKVEKTEKEQATQDVASEKPTSDEAKTTEENKTEDK